MEENNFETIINTWRRLSGEQVTEPTIASNMSGESPDFPESHRKRDEEVNTVPINESKHSAAVGPSYSSVNIPEPLVAEKREDTKEAEGKGDGKDNNDERECFVKRDRDSSKGGDSESSDGDDKDYLNNDDDKRDDKHDDKKERDSKSDKSKRQKDSDNVDSIYLRPPPAHKARSTPSNQDEDGCGIKCLYYTLQCCDCVLM